MSRARSRWMVRPALLVTALLPLGLAARGAADNPRLNLKLDNVTVLEAARKLSQESGVSVSTWDMPDGPQPPQVVEKASFDWRGVTFARAFRQLCERYHLQPMRQPGGYQVYPGAPPAPKNLKSVGLYQGQGVRMTARQVLIAGTPRALNFAGEEFEAGEGNLQLTVGCELAELDADRIAGFRNVVARDDRGTLLSFGADGEGSGDYNPSAYPDEWLTTVSLPEPNPAARKLVSVEGDLMIYKRFQHHRGEIPLPLAAPRVEKKVGELTLVASDYLVEDRQASQKKPAVAPPGGDEEVMAPRELQLKVRIHYPAGMEGGVLNQWSQPLLRMSSGRLVTGGWEGNGGQQEGDSAFMDLNIRFQPGGDPKDTPVALVWNYLERGEPTRLTRFRMTDIPLPPPRPWRAPPIPKPVAAAPEKSQTPEHPFYDASGGTLILRVHLGEGRVAAGRLTLGLAPVTNGTPGAVRWMELDVDASGLVRLPSVRAGQYQMQRRFRPAEGELPVGGRWLDDELTLEVVSGREVTAPTLRWTTEPVTRPAVKPAPKPGVKPGPKKLRGK